MIYCAFLVGQRGLQPEVEAADVTRAGPNRIRNLLHHRKAYP